MGDISPRLPSRWPSAKTFTSEDRRAQRLPLMLPKTLRSTVATAKSSTSGLSIDWVEMFSQEILMSELLLDERPWKSRWKNQFRRHQQQLTTLPRFSRRISGRGLEWVGPVLLTRTIESWFTFLFQLDRSSPIQEDIPDLDDDNLGYADTYADYMPTKRKWKLPICCATR